MAVHCIDCATKYIALVLFVKLGNIRYELNFISNNVLNKQWKSLGGIFNIWVSGLHIFLHNEEVRDRN